MTQTSLKPHSEGYSFPVDFSVLCQHSLSGGPLLPISLDPIPVHTDVKIIRRGEELSLRVHL